MTLEYKVFRADVVNGVGILLYNERPNGKPDVSADVLSATGLQTILDAVVEDGYLLNSVAIQNTSGTSRDVQLIIRKEDGTSSMVMERFMLTEARGVDGAGSINLGPTLLVDKQTGATWFLKHLSNYQWDWDRMVVRQPGDRADTKETV